MKKHGAFWMHLYPLLLFAIIVLSLLFGFAILLAGKAANPVSNRKSAGGAYGQNF